MLDWIPEENLERFEECAIIKIRQKNVNKMSDHMMLFDKNGKRMYLDVSSAHEHQNSVVLDATKTQY
jgi:hypothetical protein